MAASGAPSSEPGFEGRSRGRDRSPTETGARLARSTASGGFRSAASRVREGGGARFRPRFRREASPVGEILRRLRVERGLTQLDTADRAGVSGRHLGFVEVGRAHPSRRLILALADALAASDGDTDALLLAAGFRPVAADGGSPWHRMAIEGSPLGVLVVDTSREIVLANREMARIAGAPDAQGLESRTVEELGLWRVSEVRSAILAGLRGAQVRVRVVLGAAGRSPEPVSVIAVPLADDGGTVVGCQLLANALPGRTSR